MRDVLLNDEVFKNITIHNGMQYFNSFVENATLIPRIYYCLRSELHWILSNLIDVELDWSELDLIKVYLDEDGERNDVLYSFFPLLKHNHYRTLVRVLLSITTLVGTPSIIEALSMFKQLQHHDKEYDDQLLHEIGVIYLNHSMYEVLLMLSPAFLLQYKTNLNELLQYIRPRIDLDYLITTVLFYEGDVTAHELFSVQNGIDVATQSDMLFWIFNMRHRQDKFIYTTKNINECISAMCALRLEPYIKEERQFYLFFHHYINNRALDNEDSIAFIHELKGVKPQTVSLYSRQSKRYKKVQFENESPDQEKTVRDGSSP